jgi:hypothetical protein
LIDCGVRTQVRHHRDPGLDQSLDLGEHPATALELDGVRAGLLEEAARGLQRLGGRGLVGAEGQVRHDEGAPGALDDAADQRHQLVDGHRHRGVVAVDDVGSRVTDEQHRDACGIEQRGGGVVVGGEHRPALAAVFRGEQVERGDAPDGPVTGRWRAVQGGFDSSGHH